MKRIFVTAALVISALLLMASGAAASIDPSAAPTGAHFVHGVVPSCSVDGLTVSCNTYEIAGVGNTNADATLTASYSATVDCYNSGTNPNNPIESHTTSFSDTADSGQLSPKNGRLTVPALSVSPTTSDLQGAAYCPNANWTAVIRDGTLHLVSFTYTVTFAGFNGAFITITGP